MDDRLTRRGALALSTLAIAGLAGCAALETSDGPNDPGTTTSPVQREEGYDHSTDSLESVQVRNPEGEPAVRSSSHSPEEDIRETSAAWGDEDWSVSSSEERDALEFAQASTGVDAATEFLSETNLSEQILFVHQYRIPACRTRALDQLEWSEVDPAEQTPRRTTRASSSRVSDAEIVYRSEVRDADCESSESADVEATLVRLPAEIRALGSVAVRVNGGNA